jgi:hypothetical protein
LENKSFGAAESTPCLQIAVKTGDQNPNGPTLHAEQVDWYIGLSRNEKMKRLEAKETAC